MRSINGFCRAVIEKRYKPQVCMRSKPVITVLMSVFNGSDTLAYGIESILAQTFADFEFLIINDGSTEPVGDILQSYKDSRIRVHTQANMGLTRALNKGLRLATTDLIARMDSDDVSLPTRLERQLAVFKADAAVDLVGASFDIVDEQGRLLERKTLFVDDLYRLWRLQFHNNYGHGAVMFRRSAVNAVGNYDEALRYAQDYDLWSRLSQRDNTRVLTESLYKYRLVHDGGQASVKNSAEQLATAIAISDRNFRSCNPALTREDCINLRALYWTLENRPLSGEGLLKLAETFVRFCAKFRIEHQAKEILRARVLDDVRQSFAEQDVGDGAAVLKALTNHPTA